MPSLSALAFLVIFFSCCFISIFRSPYIGILLYEFLYFVNPPARWWYNELPDLRYSFLVVAVIMISFIVHYNEHRENRLSEVPQSKWLMALSIIMVLGYFWAVNEHVHYLVTVRYFKILIFVLLAYKIIDTPKKMEALLGVYVAGIFYISWVGWVMGRSGGGRLEGIGAADSMEVNGCAAVVVTAVPLLIFYILFAKKRWIKIAALGALAFVLNCLILLNSRGAFLALVVSGMYLYFNLYKDKVDAATQKKMIAGVVISLLLFFYLADNTFWSRMSTLQDVDPEHGSGHRIMLWMRTFAMLKDHPLGTGAYGYQILSPQYLPSEWLSRGQRAVHSTWFQTLSELGFQGLIVFVGYVFSNFIFMRKIREMLRAKKQIYFLYQSFAIESAFIALLVAGSFISFLYAELIYALPFYIAAFGNICIRMNANNSEGAEGKK
jgi:probable O-glycosylation ligase (exosortase A-associated)